MTFQFAAARFTRRLFACAVLALSAAGAQAQSSHRRRQPARARQHATVPARRLQHRERARGVARHSSVSLVISVRTCPRL